MAAVGTSEAAVPSSGAFVQPAGFTFVEEDDVAFTLRLCREVYRLYGDYQDGGLAADDYVLAGLSVTMEMLAVLSHRVVDGMPAMRVTVAAAQTREMLAVMFGRDPLDGPLEGRYRAYYRAIVDESARALGSEPAPLPAGWADATLGRSPLSRSPLGPHAGAEDRPAPASGPDQLPVAAVEPAPLAPDTDPAPLAPDADPAPLAPHADPARRSVLRRLFARRAK